MRSASGPAPPSGPPAAFPPGWEWARRTWALPALLWIVACAGGMLLRPLLPLDETRYTAVAWEMRQQGQYLVPHLNGVPYHHKPPLLFWLMNAGWSVLGVSELWARLVAPLFGLLSLFLTSVLARRLWPGHPNVAWMAPVILMGCVLFALFSSLIFFDLPLTASVLLAWLGVVTAARGAGLRGWTLAALGIGLGILFKGPVAVLHAALPALFAPLWISQRPGSWLRWYGGLLLAILGGAGIGLAWALPAARAGGPEFSRMLFFGQHAGRVVGSFQHAKPIWWYLVLLPGILFPWTAWGASWRAVSGLRDLRGDSGFRFVVPTMASALGLFSLISGKQPQYLLPLFPLAALLLARLLEGHPFRDLRTDRLPAGALCAVLGLAVLLLRPLNSWLSHPALLGTSLPEALLRMNPAWGLALGALGLLFLLDHPRTLPARLVTVAALPIFAMTLAQAAFFGVERDTYDQTPTALRVAAAQVAGRPVAILGGYEGQFTFAGRLSRPVVSLTEATARPWAESHPEALVVAIHRRRLEPGFPVQPEFIHPHRGRLCYGWRASDLISQGDLLLRDVPRPPRKASRDLRPSQ